MDVQFKFVDYGEVLNPQEDTLILDVGMKTVAGVIDHHHPQAEPECTASLIIKYPRLILAHVKSVKFRDSARTRPLQIITHRLPDFDALSSIFLALKLIETGEVDEIMAEIAAYTRLVDSASLPKTLDLTATPYSILRALFSGIKKDEEEVNRVRVEEGLKFMRFLYTKSQEGHDILENRSLFSGIERYERAMRKVEEDYLNYLTTVDKSLKVRLFLPLARGSGKKEVDGLIAKNPRSFLLKEWARRDRENPSLGMGFTFLMTNFGDKRYILGVDPELEVNLRGLGSLLNARELEKRKAAGMTTSISWYDGDCPFFNYRIVVSPQDNTSLTQEEILQTLLDFSKNPE